MLSEWENRVNHKAKEVPKMTLDSILKDIGVYPNEFELNDEFKTITYVSEQIYKEKVYEYVQPSFRFVDSYGTVQPKFIIFSAPGATGKTALARYICYKKNGIYWDLPDNKVAEFSLQGALMKAVGSSKMSTFLKSIEDGKDFLVIDAFDEAEAGSGRTGIGFFLRDLNSITENCSHTCAILLARTESALFMKNYFEENDISYVHYEVGLFAEYNAKSYIKNKLKMLGIQITDITELCIDQQFSEIRRILGSDKETESFIGYAPVLDALAMAYDEDRNTLKLLQGTKNVENNLVLLRRILEKLLAREHDKFLKALRVKVNEIANNDSITSLLYLSDEQLHRLFYIILFDEKSSTEGVIKEFPPEYAEEYLEVVGTQLPQHPFIRTKETCQGSNYEFTGAAFRDYVIAYILADSENSEFVLDYLVENPKYCPSQMLIEFYWLFADKKASGRYIPLLYNSFKSKAQSGDLISVNINGDVNDCSAEFCLIRDDNIVSKIELEVTDLENGIHVCQLSNCYIDVAGKVYVGSLSEEARISNSVISCTDLIWCGNTIAIEAYSPGKCIIDAANIVSNDGVSPHFEIKTDDRSNFKVTSCDAVKSYFKLLAYKSDDVFTESCDKFVQFSNFIRRVLSCMRSHSKDTPARKMDFIDNRIISSNEDKRGILKFLLTEHVLYTDEQDWLYKLDTDMLASFGAKWYEVRDGKFDSLIQLYDKYYSEYTTKDNTDCIKKLNAF